MTEMQVRQKIVGVMQGWVGRKEANGTHKEIIDIYNAHRPLARGYKVKYTDAWCATTVSAAAIVAGMTDIIPTECGCSAMIELFKKLGCWQENDAYRPAPGDFIFYDWQDSGAGDNRGAPDHVGMVEKVVGSTITVIEGNYSNSVKRRTIKVNGRYIRGYGLPKYSSKAGRCFGRCGQARKAGCHQLPGILEAGREKRGGQIPGRPAGQGCGEDHQEWSAVQHTGEWCQRTRQRRGH